MKHAGMVSFVFLFGMAVVAAQNPAVLTNAQAMIAPISTGSSCPIAMHARHMGGLHAIQTGKGSTPDISPEPSVPSPVLSLASGDTRHAPSADMTGASMVLSLASRDSRPITAATIKVHGLPRKTLFIPVESGAGATADASQTIQLRLTQDPEEGTFAEFEAAGIPVIQTIDLKSVTYADGSTLKLAESQNCRVAPDPLVLVDAQAASQ